MYGSKDEEEQRGYLGPTTPDDLGPCVSNLELTWIQDAMIHISGVVRPRESGQKYFVKDEGL